MAVARIQLRRDTSSNWTTANTILTEGELGYETDTDKVKIGDGNTAWNSLPYLIYALGFSDLTTTPTTIAGYGITDAFDGAFSSLSGKPTTIAGYGITDAFDGTFSALTGKPNTISGYGITDAFDGAFSSLTGKPTTISGYGITDAFDGAFSSLTGKPTTISGYGITDAFDGAFSSLSGKPTTISGYGITDAFDGAFSSLSGKPTTISGYGITDAAPLASPGLTGTPTAPTATAGTNTTQIATTAFVQTAVADVVDSAPAALDTLNELAAALGDDANFSSTVTNSIATKAPLASPALTGTPTAPTASSGTNTTQIATTAFVQSSVSNNIGLSNLSASNVSASGGGSLSYNNSSGVFTFTPPDLSNYLTSVSFGSLTSKPTTIAGYGITDAFDGAFSSLSGTPTTIAGYGITDAFDGAFSSLSSRPTTISGYGITDAFSGAFSALTGKPNTIAGYGITDAFDGAFSSLSSRPTTIAGYGITDAFSGSFSALTGKPTTLAGYGITDAFDGAFSSLSSTPTTLSGYGITDAFNGTFTALTGKPTTVAGYGITNALTTGSDADIGSNDFITTGKVYFANMFASTGDLPSATTYHGMFAHVHGTGAAYFAHGGNWVELANNSALSAKASLASPALTGTPTAPTATSGTNTTQLATTEFVTAAVAGASGTYTDSSVDTHLNTSSASSGEVLSWNGTDYDWVAQSGGSGTPLSISYAPDVKYARLELTANQSLSSANSTVVNFNTRAVDSSTNNLLTTTLGDGKFIIPAGVTKVRLKTSASTSSVSDQVLLEIKKNGSDALSTNFDIQSTGKDFPAAFTAIESVTQGDYFQVSAYSQSSRTLETSNHTWFEIEVLEGSILNQTVTGNVSIDNLSDVDTTTTAPTDGQALVWDNSASEWIPGTIATSGGGASVTTSDAAPSSPTAGDLWFNSTNLKLHVYYNDGDSSQWVQTNPSSTAVSSGTSVSTSDAAPTSPNNGDLWLDTTNNDLFVYYEDTDSSQWIELLSGGSGGASVATSDTAPTSPNDGDLWFDTTNSGLFIYYEDSDSSQWIEVVGSQGGSSTAGGTDWKEKTAAYTAVAGEGLIVDTSTAVTVTLPTSATLGDEVKIIDGTGNAATNNITVARNGHKINGDASDLTVDVDRAAFGLVYYNVAQGWLLTEK